MPLLPKETDLFPRANSTATLFRPPRTTADGPAAGARTRIALNRGMVKGAWRTAVAVCAVLPKALAFDLIRIVQRLNGFMIPRHGPLRLTGRADSGSMHLPNSRHRFVHRRGRSLRATLLLLLALAFPLPLAAQANRSVIIILMDSLRADHLQTYGYPRATTPNILELSRRGTVFEHAYPAGSWTPPSILTLLTGEYSSELNANPGGAVPLRQGHRTLATVMRSWGYTTGAFYNTAQLLPQSTNLQQGFDQYVDYGDSDFIRGRVSRGVDDTIAFLRAADKPAFVFLHILNPHHPYLPHRNYFGNVPTGKYRDSYSFATGIPAYNADHDEGCYLVRNFATVPEMVELYDSEIRELDVEVGRLVKFLDGDRRYRDAVVIVTGDHGEEFGEHGGLYHGARFYEESLHVPLIVRDPSRRYGVGRRVPDIVSLVDVVPTILNLVDIPFEPSAYSGHSLFAYFTRRGGSGRDTAFIERQECGYDNMNAIRKGKWKMIVRMARAKTELYDLEADPAEQHDLSGSKRPDVRAAFTDLYTTFERWYRHVNRPLATRAGDKTPPLPPELRERLKALGYVNGE